MSVDRRTLDGLDPAGRARILTETPEGQWFERKSARSGLDVIARSLIGFANAEGGLLAIGISEGRVEDVSAHRRNEIRRVPLTHCAPAPRVHFHEITAEQPGAEARIMLAEVEPGEGLHETTGGDCYLRVGDSTTKLSAAQREELAYDRGSAHFEARPMPGVSIADLDPAQVQTLRSTLGVSGTDHQLLAARSLLSSRGEVSVAGYLLLAEHPQTLMPHAHVRILRYLSPAPGTGARHTMADDGDRRIEGPLPKVLEAATRQIDEWMPNRRALKADGRFGPVQVVPRDAWLEGLVNAVVHRSYSMAGDHIRVALFPDRVEIESPGRFPGIVDPEHPLDIARYARNPRIARVCNDLGYTQEEGEGIKRMFDEMRILGLADPVYKQTSGSVRLLLYSTPRLSAEAAARLPTGAQRVLEALRTAGAPLGTGDIATVIGLQRPATLRALRALQDLGEVEWHGRSKTDPRAVWSLPSSSQP